MSELLNFLSMVAIAWILAGFVAMALALRSKEGGRQLMDRLEESNVLLVLVFPGAVLFGGLALIVMKLLGRGRD